MNQGTSHRQNSQNTINRWLPINLISTRSDLRRVTKFGMPNRASKIMVDWTVHSLCTRLTVSDLACTRTHSVPKMRTKLRIADTKTCLQQAREQTRWVTCRTVGKAWKISSQVLWKTLPPSVSSSSLSNKLRRRIWWAKTVKIKLRSLRRRVRAGDAALRNNRQSWCSKIVPV